MPGDGEDILERAANLYRAAAANYRDALLQVGQLLHEFILENLEIGQRMNKEERNRLGLNRGKLVLRCAIRLHTQVCNIHRYIMTAMVVKLLSDGMELGSFGHDAIRRFSVFIRRQRCQRDDQPVTDRERWVIREGFEESAKALFRRAVKEGWGEDRVSKEGRKCFPLADRATNRRGRPKTESPPPRLSLTDEDDCENDVPEGGWMGQIKASARKASPGDVAELCMVLVRESRDPQGVLMRLEREIEKWKAAKAARRA